MPSLRPWRDAMFAAFAFLAAFACFAATASAHDFERTRVTLTFARDGSFVLDVTNDAAWLEHRLIPFRNSDPRGTPSFADRVVLFIDGGEVRPESVEMVANAPPLVTYRMRGRVPPTAHALRWYYGLPIDPYPLTIRRADGRIVVEEIAGDAWSRPIDLSGQFAAARVSGTTVGIGIAVLFAIPIAIRYATTSRKHET